jgi:hypothetical protein
MLLAKRGKLAACAPQQSSKINGGIRPAAEQHGDMLMMRLAAAAEPCVGMSLAA